MILKRHQILSLLCLFCFTISACSQRNYQNRDETLAVVNDRSIRLEEFQKQLTPIQGFQGMDTRSISGKKEILDNMVTQELIFQEALKEGFHLENLEVKHAIVDQYLKKKFQADVERVTETDVKKYYDKYAQRLDRVRASHIIIKVDEEDTQHSEAEKKATAKKKIESILNDIHNGAITFEEAAKKYSEDGSKEKDGDLGYFFKGQMVKPFEDKAFSMQTIGEMSGIIETKFGYHIIKLTGRQVGYEFHRPRIRRHLIKTAIEEKTKLYKAELKNDNKVEIFYDKLPKDKTEQAQSS
ncbi:MAG: peptidylprolyl isomerase [Deltaproteobacteria bacterium]|nr:peptidylprolyl isomerase [Deltaproteobacteria bacterium]